MRAKSHVKAVSRQRLDQIAHPRRHRARTRAHYQATKAKNPKIRIWYECPCPVENKHLHHPDYSLPLDVVRLCQSCHASEHVRLRGGHAWYRRIPHEHKFKDAYYSWTCTVNSIGKQKLILVEICEVCGKKQTKRHCSGEEKEKYAQPRIFRIYGYNPSIGAIKFKPGNSTGSRRDRLIDEPKTFGHVTV